MRGGAKAKTCGQDGTMGTARSVHTRGSARVVAHEGGGARERRHAKEVVHEGGSMRGRWCMKEVACERGGA